MKSKTRSKRPAKSPTKAQRRKETPAKSPAAAADTTIPIGALVPQDHGGALRNGALPGTNAGGPGRPSSQIRAALAASFDKRIVIYETIADDKNLTSTERMKAVSEMGRLGLEHKLIEVADIRQHPEAIRFIACYHQALELLTHVDRDRVTARVDELLFAPALKS